MKQVDAAVIGGGILGCFTARNLRRWRISTLLIEKEDDVCREISKANSAIVYAGYDNKPGSLKAELTVRGNAQMDALCAVEKPMRQAVICWILPPANTTAPLSANISPRVV